MSKAKSEKKQGMMRQVLGRLAKNKTAMFALVILCILVIIAIIGPWIVPYDYSAVNITDRYMFPCAKHLFGTDSMGRDLFSRVIYGTRYSLSIGFTATLVGTLLGMVIGAIAGYFGKTTDNIIMRGLDIIQAIPGMLLMIVLAAVLGTGFTVTIIALSIGCAAGNARLFRAAILNIRSMEYIEAAQSINCSTAKTIVKHIVPNALSPMIVSFTMGMAGNIVVASTLSFIGLGVQAPIPEWGALLSTARTDMRLYPYLVIFPGLAIMITVFALNMLGDGLRDALDPKLKN